MIESKATYLAYARGCNFVFLHTKYPRKELMEYHGVKHAEKVYVNDGDHIGYVVAGNWYTLYKIEGVGL